MLNEDNVLFSVENGVDGGGGGGSGTLPLLEIPAGMLLSGGIVPALVCVGVVLGNVFDGPGIGYELDEDGLPCEGTPGAKVGLGRCGVCGGAPGVFARWKSDAICGNAERSGEGGGRDMKGGIGEREECAGRWCMRRGSSRRSAVRAVYVCVWVCDCIKRVSGQQRANGEVKVTYPSVNLSLTKLNHSVHGPPHLGKKRRSKHDEHRRAPCGALRGAGGDE